MCFTVGERSPADNVAYLTTVQSAECRVCCVL